MENVDNIIIPDKKEPEVNLAELKDNHFREIVEIIKEKREKIRNHYVYDAGDNLEF